jgi:hypothetical protein
MFLGSRTKKLTGALESNSYNQPVTHRKASKKLTITRATAFIKNKAS